MIKVLFKMLIVFKRLQQIIINWCLSKKTVTISFLHTNALPRQCAIYGPDEKLKFTEISNLNNFAIETDNGYALVKHSFKTVPYKIWNIKLENGLELNAADTHILIKSDKSEVFIKDLQPCDLILTKRGLSKVVSFTSTSDIEEMYDLELEDDRHLFYTNNILSHNTQTISMYLLWYAMFHDDKTVVIASKNNGHAMEIMDRIRYAYEELPHWLKAGCKYYNKHNIEFDNGSRIKSEATTEKTGRGLAISKLYLDELAFISHKIQTAMWRSLAPTLSTGGEIIISSTPNGDTDLFATLWNQAKLAACSSEEDKDPNAFVPVYYPWNRHPERDETYLKQMQAELGPIGFRQEVLVEFISSEATLIDSLKLSFIRTKQQISENMGFKFWTQNIGGRGKTYLVGLDPASGNGKDFTVIEVFEFPKMEQIAELRLNSVNIPLIYAKLKWLFRLLRRPDAGKGRADIIWSFERNGVGEALVALIQNDDSPDGGVYIDGVDLYNENPLRLGVYTTGKSKMLACMQLKNLIEKGDAPGGFKIYSDLILFELQNFVAIGGSFGAKPGHNDDTISALTVIMKCLSRLASYDDKARRIIYESVDPDSDRIDEDVPQDQFGDEPVPVFF